MEENNFNNQVNQPIQNNFNNQVNQPMQNNMNNTTSEGNTNDKNTVFGQSSDGRDIVSARKIKGELFGGYILFGVLFSIVIGIIVAVLTAVIVGNSLSGNNLISQINLLNEYGSKTIIVSVIAGIFGIAESILVVLVSSKICFNKRKIRKRDIGNVMKFLIIIEIVLTLLSSGYSCIKTMVNKSSIDSAVVKLEEYQKDVEKLRATYSTRKTESTSSSDSTTETKEVIKKYKSKLTISTIIGIIVAIIGKVLALFYQKKLLEKNAEEV